MDRDRLVKGFTYYSPKDDEQWKFDALRNHAKNLALLIDNYVPDSREKSIAITNLEQAIFWANAGLARNQEPVTIAGAMVPKASDQGMLFPEREDIPADTHEVIKNIQTLLAETEGCGGKCKCNKRYS